MFSESSFSELSFADFFTSSGIISYEFRKARTIVTAVIADDGKIINDVPQVTLRTKVEANQTRNVVPS